MAMEQTGLLRGCCVCLRIQLCVHLLNIFFTKDTWLDKTVSLKRFN